MTARRNLQAASAVVTHSVVRTGLQRAVADVDVISRQRVVVRVAVKVVTDTAR